MDERLYPIGSYYLGGRNLNMETKAGFGKWECKGIRTPSGKYVYERVG